MRAIRNPIRNRRAKIRSLGVSAVKLASRAELTGNESPVLDVDRLQLPRPARMTLVSHDIALAKAAVHVSLVARVDAPIGDRVVRARFQRSKLVHVPTHVCVGLTMHPGTHVTDSPILGRSLRAPNGLIPVTKAPRRTRAGRLKSVLLPPPRSLRCEAARSSERIGVCSRDFK